MWGGPHGLFASNGTNEASCEIFLFSGELYRPGLRQRVREKPVAVVPPPINAKKELLI